MSDSAPVVRSPKTTSSALTSAERDLDLGQQMALIEVEAVGVRRREGHAERLATRDDRDLAHGVSAGRQHADDRVTSLVVGGPLPVLVADHHAACGAEHDPLQRVGEVFLADVRVAALCCQQRTLVDQVGEVGADHAGRRRRDLAEVDLRCQRNRPRMHLQNRLAAVAVGRLTRRRGGRSGPGAAAPSRGSPGGWWRPARSRRCARQSRPSR